MRQRYVKTQRKNAGGRNSKHPINPHPKPLSVQSAVRGVHQESVSTATNEHARIDHQSSQQSWSARNETSSSSYLVSWYFEPSRPQRLTSRLNTNFTLSPSPSYSFHKSLHTSHMFFEPIQILQALNTGTCIWQVTYFSLWAYTGTMC